MRLFFLHILLTILVGLSSPAHAQLEPRGQEPDRYVKIRALAERGAVGPGEEIWIGIEQSIYPHWHTYWQNPGDSGAPPSIEWSLPKGFEISEIYFPIPKKIPYGPLTNYGYEDHVIFLQKLKAPDALPGGPINLKADLEILVCEEICIPEFSELSVTLNGPGAQLEDNSAYLQEARNALPMNSNWMVLYKEANEYLQLDFPQDLTVVFDNIDQSTIEFFPIDWGVVDNAVAPAFSIEEGRAVLRQKRGDRPLGELKNIKGLLAFTDPEDQRQAVSFVSYSEYAKAEAEPQNAGQTGLSFISAIIFAVLGGMILNLMPCVFPVLSIKALSLIKLSKKKQKQAKLHGLSYTAGIVLSFIAIAALLMALKAGGEVIGWGFQLQNPVVVTILAYLLFIIGLNLSGFFEIASSFGNLGKKLTGGDGLSGSFFTGILATLVATPCTAPFMAGAIGYALLQPAGINLTIFAALGFGLALPYLVLSFAPALQKKLPKPGKWMETFRQFLAFPMFASAAWLTWVVNQQVGSMGVFGILLGLVAIAFGIWLLKNFKNNIVKALAIISFIIALGFLPVGYVDRPAPEAEISVLGETFSPEKLTEALQGHGPVFVEMTAAWCITCKVNHAVAINIESTKNLFEEKNVQYLVGDWTNQDPIITEYLNSYGRNGVPIYVYYGPRDKASGKRPEPKVLPQILTPGIIAEIINA